ncbi:Rho-type gtpase-activating protein [Elasticomyces elasticus]|nr:Rho-type gtpase-activating protein [Elasticomyces elasticus]
MARRRKKSKTAARQASAGANGSSVPIVLDKSLPALPPSAVSASVVTPDPDSSPSDVYTETPTERSPRPKQAMSRKDVSKANLRRSVSPISNDTRKDGLILPASTYGENDFKENRVSAVSMISEPDDDRGFLPMTFNPDPAPGPPPMSKNRKLQQDFGDAETPKTVDNKGPRDYFSGRVPSRSVQRDTVMKEQLTEERKSMTDIRENDGIQQVNKQSSSPHIAYQEKGRQPIKRKDVSGGSTPATTSAAVSPVMGTTSEKLDRPRAQHSDTQSFTLGHGEPFKLQEVPKTKRSASRRSSKNGNKSPTLGSSRNASNGTNTPSLEPVMSSSPTSMGTPASATAVNPFDEPRRRDAPPSVGLSGLSNSLLLPSQQVERPQRGDSLAASSHKSSVSSREPLRNGTPEVAILSTATLAKHNRNASSSSVPSHNDSSTGIPRDNSRLVTKAIESPTVRALIETPVAPPRASSRPSAPSASVANDDFIAPRAPPPPPPVERHRNNESISTLHSEISRYDTQPNSPVMRSALPKHTAGGEFSMEEEMARILRGDERLRDESESGPTNMLRRVSNAVKHGRSFSDRGLRSSGKSPRSSANDISTPMIISSPLIASPSMKEDVAALNAQLRRAQSRIAELETEKNGLEEKVNSSVDIKQVNTELREKRSTMAILDTQREMIVRELEIMTEHLAKAKDSNKPLDIYSLKSDVMQDFANSLQSLKDTLGVQIEDLVHKRNELTDEISTLIQMKDRGFQEYENLTAKNTQLAEMNNQLVQSIQELYKANRMPNGPNFDGGFRPNMFANGLGIYTHHQRDRPDLSSVDVRQVVSQDGSMATLLQETEAEPATMLTAPQVVNIRKGQPKKFNWKKGGQAVAKNVTKGIKGAFASGDRYPVNMRDGQYNVDGVPYAMQATPGSEGSSVVGRQGLEAGKNGGGQNFGFFAQKGGKLQPSGLGNFKNGSSTNIAAEGGSVLFGSELSARCEYEQRSVPFIVSRLIDEVEQRGMDIEGVYRKSGGSGQVKAIQTSFEKSDGLDISDPDLDIHAITSALKQYFRRLPTPLITFDAYDALLSAGQVQDKDKQVQAMRMAVHELPLHHRECLEYLTEHLARVMAHEAENLMTPLNLSVVFAPTIMRPLSIERELTDMQPQRMAVQSLLENHQLIFGE